MSDQLELTPQQVFDTVLTFLRKQKKPSLIDGDCVYRGVRGMKCAVGCLIEDSEYTPQMEGESVITLFMDKRLPNRLIPHVELLKKLQQAHDSGLTSFRNPESQWETQMKDIATDFELLYKEV